MLILRRALYNVCRGLFLRADLSPSHPVFRTRNIAPSTSTGRPFLYTWPGHLSLHAYHPSAYQTRKTPSPNCQFYYLLIICRGDVSKSFSLVSIAHYRRMLNFYYTHMCVHWNLWSQLYARIVSKKFDAVIIKKSHWFLWSTTLWQFI